MKIKTAELTGAALNWVVASIEWPNDTGILNPELVDKESVNEEYPFDADWQLTETIANREKITVVHGNDIYFPKGNERGDYYELLMLASTGSVNNMHGSTRFIAILRCHVANKLGDEVEVPDHLL